MCTTVWKNAGFNNMPTGNNVHSGTFIHVKIIAESAAKLWDENKDEGAGQGFIFLQTPFLHRMKCHDSLSSPRGRKEGEKHPQNSQHHESSV